MRLPLLAFSLLLTACGAAPEPAVIASPHPVGAPAAGVSEASPPAVVAKPGSPEASRVLLNDYLAAWNSHDAESTAAFLADDAVVFDSLLGNLMQGRTEARDKVIGMYMRAVPNGQWTLRNEPVVSADGFSYEWSLTGVNLGDWASYLHGKGQKIDFKGVSIVRLKNGKIVYQANYYDTNALGQQAGW